jgi:histidyl-tRNA synthetase
MQKPSIPKGTRDFPPQEMAKRNYIFDTIRTVFHLYGFQSIETPALENLPTLLGKYGEEGDKLLFKVLNSGDFLAKVSFSDLASANPARLTRQISEKGLRYDLTVPFARYVVMHRNEIILPFRRFQIQPVWRADRPQKGRYREFYQCDADIIGSDSLLNELELIQIINDVFQRLNIRVSIQINNRKILAGIAETIHQADKIVDITTAIDKLDKIGLPAVNAELAEKGLPAEAIDQLQPIILLSGSNHDKLATLQTTLANSPIGLQGLQEIDSLLQKLAPLPLSSPLNLDLTLARGLNYYTGAILEVKSLDVSIGSIAGGGRYDNLTSVFGIPDLSGVGISFGADRIFDVLNHLDLYPETALQRTQVLFVNFGDREEAYLLPHLARLRAAGISAEIYPEPAKLKKQFSYASGNCIPFVVIAGDDEIQSNQLSLKNMITGQQESFPAAELEGRVRG